MLRASQALTLQEQEQQRWAQQLAAAVCNYRALHQLTLLTTQLIMPLTPSEYPLHTHMLTPSNHSQCPYYLLCI
jgi:hypothetical protein